MGRRVTQFADAFGIFAPWFPPLQVAGVSGASFPVPIFYRVFPPYVQCGIVVFRKKIDVICQTICSQGKKNKPRTNAGKRF